MDFGILIIAFNIEKTINKVKKIKKREMREVIASSLITMILGILLRRSHRRKVLKKDTQIGEAALSEHERL